MWIKVKELVVDKKGTTQIKDLKFENIENIIEKFEKDYSSLWNTFLKDNDIYIDIRKNNYIEVYYNGGRILKIEKKHKYAQKKFVENIIKIESSNRSCCVDNKINCLEKNIKDIKNKLKKSYPNDSEKGIQGKYASNKEGILKKGLILDTEFAFNGFKYKEEERNIRIDMVYLEIDKNIPKLYFVELKTDDDSRLDIRKCEESNKKRNQKDKKPITHIQTQLEEYTEFTNKYKQELKKYYTNIFDIKRRYNLLGKFNPKIVEQIGENIGKLSIIEKPILLIVGDKKEFENKVDLLSAYDLSSCCLKICNKLEN